MSVEIKVKVTKYLYKAFDSYQRRQRWEALQFIKFMKERYGLEKANKIRKREEGRG